MGNNQVIDDKMKSEKPKKRPEKRDIIFNITAAVAAVGFLLIQLFVTPEQLTGPTFLHELQIACVLLAVISAFGIAYTAMKKTKKQKQ